LDDKTGLQEDAVIKDYPRKRVALGLHSDTNTSSEVRPFVIVKKGTRVGGSLKGKAPVGCKMGTTLTVNVQQAGAPNGGKSVFSKRGASSGSGNRRSIGRVKANAGIFTKGRREKNKPYY